MLYLSGKATKGSHEPLGIAHSSTHALPPFRGITTQRKVAMNRVVSLHICPQCHQTPVHVTTQNRKRLFCSRSCAMSAVRRTQSTLAVHVWQFIKPCQHFPACTQCCWEWQGSRITDGYGTLMHHRKRYKAHAIAYDLSMGQRIPPGLFVCHQCDNPPCCNPAHLFVGTHSDNMKDAYNKGRLTKVWRPGEQHQQAILSTADVVHIRCMYSNGICYDAIHSLFPKVTRNHIINVAKERKRRNG